MQEQFVPYKLALKLKNLGFNEECFGHFITKAGWLLDLSEGSFYFKDKPSNKTDEYSILTPLWQQAFDWFREQHGIHVEIYMVKDCDVIKWDWDIVSEDFEEEEFDIEPFLKYEDARLSVLEKLVEIMSNKNSSEIKSLVINPVMIAAFEYERGWGSKLDDWMVCLNKEDAEKFKKEFNSKNTEDTAPDWYMQVEGDSKEIYLTESQLEYLKQEGRVWLSTLKNK